jgi:hypothetical protein
MLLRYCPSDFEMVPVAPNITGIIFASTFHMRWIFVVRFLHFKIFAAPFFWTHFCLQKLQHLLICVVLFYCHGLWVQFIVRNSSVSSHLLVP